MNLNRVAMGLIKYKRKRKFDETPEPTGGKATGKQLVFVVQKHQASQLHYDFRLELNGVLLSWAIPKGPSLNPAEKRLAMLVEDHPFDYKDFEGIIPDGNYGAGTVIIWDKGTYEPVGEFNSKADREKEIAAAFRKGSLKIRMHGEKLKGEFALIRTKGRGENSWLLIKHRDEYASQENVSDQEYSVVSGKSINEVAGDKKSTKWGSNRSSGSAKNTSLKKKVMSQKKTSTKKNNAKTTIKKALALVKKKSKSSMPLDVKPMLAMLVDEPFDEPGWLYEVKWDGYRSISYLQGGEVLIRSRNNKDFNKKFYPVYDALKSWSINAVVDGEIVVLNERGEPDFEALQEWRSEADGTLVYYLFDILWLDGVNLMDVPLVVRKKILQTIIPGDNIIRFSETFDVPAKEFFVQADKLGLEGIMAKKEYSVYKPDVRGKDWLKIKTQKHQDAVIGGYTKNKNSRKKFSALLLGVFDHGRFVFIGPVGTGFDTKDQTEILEKLSPLETKNCPFSEVPDYNKPSRFRPNPPKAEVIWVKPQVVIEIAYRTKSKDGSLRHPAYRGIREDKMPNDVGYENVLPISEIDPETKPVKSTRKIINPPQKEERKTLLNPKDETQVRRVNGHELKFTNLSKVFWPEEGYTKRDMLNYYYQIAPVMLPYMIDRPQTLNRFPNGIYGKSFYQKDVTGKVPGWIETYQYFSQGDQQKKHFLVCTNEESLLYIASLGCIEMNPWSSRRETPDHPDFCIIDLDPDEKNTFDQVIQTAQVTRQILDSLSIRSYCKTSGSTGLHIYIPLQARYTYEESKEFGRALVKIVNRELPGFTSIERKVSDRKGKMYLDFLQNRPQATVAGPYSLRPKPGAPVSMPLHWDEVKKGLTIQKFNLKNAVARVRSEGDLFSGVLDKGIDINKAMIVLMKTFGKLNE